MFALFFCTFALTLIAALWGLVAVSRAADDAARRRSLARLHPVFAVLGCVVATWCLFCAFGGTWRLGQPDVADQQVNRMNATGGTGIVVAGVVSAILAGLWIAANVVAARRTGDRMELSNGSSRRR